MGVATVTGTPYSEIPRLEMEPLDDGPVARLIPRGDVTCIAGIRECGKSWLTLKLATDETLKGNQVVCATFEDSPAYTVKGRIEGMGAVQENVIDLTEEMRRHGFRALREFLEDPEHQWTTMVLIDPLDALGANQYGPHVRANIETLQRISAQYDVSTVLVHHPIKDGETLGGSQQLENVLRVILWVQNDEFGIRTVTVRKNSLTENRESATYTVKSGAARFTTLADEAATRYTRGWGRKLSLVKEAG
jgi:predicted ATP-dependent serine protease